ncbi:MAG: helix-turn-helix domain-containing protein [bacterium]
MTHQQAAITAGTRPRWTTISALAEYLGVCRVTVHRWIKSKRLIGHQIGTRHYSDERERKTQRYSWRIYERDLAEFFGWYRGRAGGGSAIKLPVGLWVRLRGPRARWGRGAAGALGARRLGDDYVAVVRPPG